MIDPLTPPDPAANPALLFRDEVKPIERLRRRAREQIAALASTVAKLERLRKEIDQHLPRQRRSDLLPSTGSRQQVGHPTLSPSR